MGLGKEGGIDQLAFTPVFAVLWAVHPAPKHLLSRRNGWEPPAPFTSPFAQLGSLGNKPLLWS